MAMTEMLSTISPHCVMLYNIATANPIQIAITIISAKFGIPKALVVIILAFIL